MHDLARTGLARPPGRAPCPRVQPAAVLFPGLLLLAGCAAALRAPELTVERLAVKGVRVTGLGLDVSFLVRNPNPEPIHIERFEYELVLNGHRLGRGYQPDSLHIDGFAQRSVVSRFDLNFLSVPGTVKDMLDHDRARVEVSGKFYVRDALRVRPLGFRHGADVPLSRGDR